MSSNLLSPQVELKIQRGIRQAEDKVVVAIQAALDDKKTYGELEESQFRNLVRVAETTDSTEVIKNFLRYQVGRDKKWGRGKASLASRIIKDIDNLLKKLAEKISKEVGEEFTQRVWLDLIRRRYLGYGSRHLKYLNPSKK